MPRFASGPERVPGQFANLEEFISFAREQCPYDARIHFAKPNGERIYLMRDQAIEALRSVARFIKAPEHEPIMALHDGRMIVAHDNLCNLTQHLRWKSGLDSDSKPRQTNIPRPKLQHLPEWPYAAQLWFWRNGGKPLDGESGSFVDWLKRIRCEPTQHFNVHDAGHLAQQMPQASQDECPF